MDDGKYMVSLPFTEKLQELKAISQIYKGLLGFGTYATS